MKRSILFACVLGVVGMLAFFFGTNFTPLPLLFVSPQVASTILGIIAFSPVAIFTGKKLSDWANVRMDCSSGPYRDTVRGPSHFEGELSKGASRLPSIAPTFFQRSVSKVPASSLPSHNRKEDTKLGSSSTR